MAHLNHPMNQLRYNTYNPSAYPSPSSFSSPVNYNSPDSYNQKPNIHNNRFKYQNNLNSYGENTNPYNRYQPSHSNQQSFQFQPSYHDPYGRQVSNRQGQLYPQHTTYSPSQMHGPVDPQYGASYQYGSAVQPAAGYDQYATADSSYTFYGSPKGYGGDHGGGYGGGHGGGYGGYDHSPALSALALLGFLFFLNLIQQTLMANIGTGTGRSTDLPGRQHHQDLELELRARGVLLDTEQWQDLTLLVSRWLVVMYRQNHETDWTCRRAAFCEMSKQLQQSFGLVGRLITYLSRALVRLPVQLRSEQWRLQEEEVKWQHSSCSTARTNCQT